MGVFTESREFESSCGHSPILLQLLDLYNVQFKQRTLDSGIN